VPRPAGRLFFETGRSSARDASSGEVFPGAGDGQFAVHYPFRRDQGVGEAANPAGFAAHQQNLQTMVVVQVNMHRGQNDLAAVLVLQSREQTLQMRLVMIVDKGDRPDDLLAWLFPMVLHELGAQHVGDGVRPVRVALASHGVIKPGSEVAGQ